MGKEKSWEKVGDRRGEINSIWNLEHFWKNKLECSHSKEASEYGT